MVGNRTEQLRAAHARFAYAKPSKSMLAVFLIWLLLAYFGGHRFYTGRIASGFAMLGLLVCGIVTALAGAWNLGNVMIAADILWAWADLLFIWGWVRSHNDGRRGGYAFS